MVIDIIRKVPVKGVKVKSENFFSISPGDLYIDGSQMKIICRFSFERQRKDEHRKPVLCLVKSFIFLTVKKSLSLKQLIIKVVTFLIGLKSLLY